MTIPKQLLEAKICNKNTCDLQDRINKAIEYIEKTRNTLLLSYPPKEALDIDKLLDILKGSDKE